MMRSISSAFAPVDSKSRFTAIAPMYDDPAPSFFRMWRVLIPTRVVIHSSLVSTILESMSLSRMSSGTYDAIPEMRAFNIYLCRILGFRCGVKCKFADARWSCVSAAVASCEWYCAGCAGLIRWLRSFRWRCVHDSIHIHRIQCGKRAMRRS